MRSGNYSNNWVTERLKSIQDYFRQGYTSFESSYNEAEVVLDLFDDRTYTMQQIAELRSSGRPIETYNVVKKYTRNLVGYLSTVQNTITAKPTNQDRIAQVVALDHALKYVLRKNSWQDLQDEINEEAALTGLNTIHYKPKNTGKVDKYDRPIYEIEIENIQSKHVVMDPLSTKPDYSDARYTHVWKWIPEEEMKRLFGSNKVKKLSNSITDNNIDAAFAAKEYNFIGLDDGKFKKFNNYLVVHSVVKTKQGRWRSTYWCNDYILNETMLDYAPYKCFRLHKGKKNPEFYGVFREVIESQKAINQAVLQIQLLVNTNKAFVEKNAVDDIDEFTREFNRVNAVIEVEDLQGIKVETLTSDVIAQYHIIDRAIDRIQAILGINDSFLGMANASDSGRKVRLQQESSIVALRYFTRHISYMYSTIGKDIINLIQQFMTANMMLRILDHDLQDKWMEVNKPFLMPTGEYDEIGRPVFQYVAEPVFNNEGEVEFDEQGNIKHNLVNESDSDLTVRTDVDIEVVTSAYGETDDIERVMLENMVQGAPGMMLQQMYPAGYANLLGIYAKSLKSRYSQDITALFKTVQEMASGMPVNDPREQGQFTQQMQGNGSASSQALSHALGSTNDLKSNGYNAKTGGQ